MLQIQQLADSSTVDQIDFQKEKKLWFSPLLVAWFRIKG
jgi:hypothetical protein